MSRLHRQAEIPVILNPKARSARAGERAQLIGNLSRRARVLETRTEGDAHRLASELVAAGAPLIVVAGGDGTINKAVNGMERAGGLEAGTRLGILPSGTMNVFATELALPKNDLHACWEAIEHGSTREIDLWRANQHHFVQLAGVGLDADIIEHTTWEMKRAFGPMSYVIAAARQMRQFRAPLVVRPEGFDPIAGTAVLFGNGRHYGGPFKIFPDASIDDHLIDIVVFRKHGYRELLKFLRAVAITGYGDSDSICYLQAPSVVVVSGAAAPVEVDGDLVDKTPVTVRRSRFPLRVAVPAPAAGDAAERLAAPGT